MFGPGRPKATPNIIAVRPLTEEDLASYAPASDTNRVKKIRESHHRVAKLMALGLRNFEITELTGYSGVRLSHFRQDPAFMNLVAKYKGQDDEAFVKGRDVYYDTVISNRQLSASELNDRLHEDPSEFTVAQLVAIHADAADRTGYPKRTVATNINVDFAARLDKAYERSMKVVNPSPALSAPAYAIDGGGTGGGLTDPRQEVLPPEPLKRRA